MATAKYLLLDVFTDRAFRGNQLAVFPDGALEDAAMQRIARELNLPESVFATRGEGDVAAELRIFTPGREIPFAGHPTIGAAIAVVDELLWINSDCDAFVFRERVGDVAIAIDRGAPTTAWLTTPPTFLRRTIERSDAAAFLSVGIDDVRSDVPPRICGAGSVFLFVPLVSREAVDRATLDESALRRCVDYAEITGVYFFAHDGDEFYARMCAPMSGIAEDPATGSAAGPLCFYLAEYGALPKRERFLALQGVAMGRRSDIHLRCTWDGDTLVQADVGGNAVIVGRGEITVPDGAPAD